MASTEDYSGQRLAALDMLRLLAVLAVWAYHANLTHYGYLGVEIFFMISGFVIALTARHRDPVAFAFARAARLYPAFLICFGLTLLALETRFGGAQIAANLTMMPKVFGQRPVEGAYWSLAVEIIFYGFIALLLCLKHDFSTKLAAFSVLWLLASAANLVSPLPFKVPLLLDWAPYFCVGCTAFLMREGMRGALLLWLAAIGVAAVAAGAQTYHEPLIAGSIVAAAGLAFPVIARLEIAIPLARLSGAISYPIYLIHHRFGDAMSAKLNSPVWGGVCVIATAWLVTRLEPHGKRLVLALGQKIGRAQIRDTGTAAVTNRLP